MANNPGAELEPVVGKAIRRLIPFLLLMYVLAFLDRVNVGFAMQAFQADTGVSKAAFALGAGIFFIGYALFEVPSNLILHRVGARMWMSRIMVTWGLVSAATMFARGESSFVLLRFLLGVAEAGFFPGVIYYLSCWFPAQARARVVGLFYFGAPLAFIFGGPLSGSLLGLHGLFGIAGWKWMFLIEGLLATAVGVWALWYLDDRPEQARWLEPVERELLARIMNQEQAEKLQHGPSTAVQALASGRVLYLTLIYFLIQMSVYGVVFYLPTQVAALLGTKVGFKVGLVTAVPWVCALAATWLIPRLADRSGLHRIYAALTLTCAGLGIALSVAAPSPIVALLALCVAAAGFIAVQPLFWSFPTAYLAGAAAAGGLAWINSLGGLGGFVAPLAKTWVEVHFHSSHAGLYMLAATTLLGAALLAALRAGPARSVSAVVSRPSR